ncbi:MAG: MocR-like pyridoxine biosynthesis transcription factor PdxR [Solirubrobacteraceae bacterium]
MALDETSQPIELLLSVSRDGPRTLGGQIEDKLRRAIRDGALPPDARVPSTRDLARQLGVSRRVVVDAYAQLAAEGYLSLRQGARPRVSASAAIAGERLTTAAPPAHRSRFDFRPSVPDVSTFPRAAWLRSLRHALATITDAELGYGDPRGVLGLRVALADYLGRVRGVVADPEHVIVTNGYTQGLGLVCEALASAGATRIALEDPSNPEDALVAARAGLEAVCISVDEAGTRIEDLRQARADAVVLTPAHQHPTGVVLTGERRTALLAWLRERGAIAIEDDYDAEYRYDRAAVGALQGLDPDRVVYAGSASKTLAPGLRLGWFVMPGHLAEPMAEAKIAADRGSPALEQLALADLMAKGEFDRHLRRMRPVYRRRRDALLAALSRRLPWLEPAGVSAGLHLVTWLPPGLDEATVVDAAAGAGVGIEGVTPYRISHPGPGGLIFGYATVNEQAIEEGVDILAGIIAGL